MGCCALQDLLLSVHLKGGLLKAFSAEFAAARKVTAGMLAQATDEQLHVIILLTLFEGSIALEAAAEVVGKDSRLLQGQLQVHCFPNECGPSVVGNYVVVNLYHRTQTKLRWLTL